MSQGADIPLDRAAYYLEDVSRQLNPKEAYALLWRAGVPVCQTGCQSGILEKRFLDLAGSAIQIKGQGV